MQTRCHRRFSALVVNSVRAANMSFKNFLFSDFIKLLEWFGNSIVKQVKVPRCKVEVIWAYIQVVILLRLKSKWHAPYPWNVLYLWHNFKSMDGFATSWPSLIFCCWHLHSVINQQTGSYIEWLHGRLNWPFCSLRVNIWSILFLSSACSHYSYSH